mgnify:CR=1 FL=1
MSDLGSIRQVGNRFYNIKEYILKSIDVSKLDLIEDAADGSTAWCTDTQELYILHLGEWIKQ